MENLKQKFLGLRSVLAIRNSDGETIIYELDVPGFTKNDLKIRLNKNLLRITGKIKRKNGKIVEISESLNVSGLICVDASVENGILTLKFDKFENNGEEIEIK